LGKAPEALNREEFTSVSILHVVPRVSLQQKLAAFSMFLIMAAFNFSSY